jgi:hypothetical protein
MSKKNSGKIFRKSGYLYYYEKNCKINRIKTNELHKKDY